MIILTIENVPGKEIKEVKGLVKGSTVRCKNIGRDITASFKNLVGGEMSGYNDMLTEARQIAIGRMVDEAEAIGANAIIGMKLNVFCCSSRSSRNGGLWYSSSSGIKRSNVF